MKEIFKYSIFSHGSSLCRPISPLRKDTRKKQLEILSSERFYKDENSVWKMSGRDTHSAVRNYWVKVYSDVNKRT